MDRTRRRTARAARVAAQGRRRRPGRARRLRCPLCRVEGRDRFTEPRRTSDRCRRRGHHTGRDVEGRAS